MRKTYMVLAATYLSYVVLGFYDPAFAVAWPVMRYDMLLNSEQAGIIIIFNSVMYALAGVLAGRFSRYIRPEKINLMGIVLIIAGLTGVSLA